MNFSVRLNTNQTERAIRQLKSRAPVAIARALNRSIASGKTVMVREVSADMKLKQSYVRDRIGIREAAPLRQVAQLTASPKRIPVFAFGATGPVPSRGRGRGVRARTRSGRYPHAFIATVGAGHIGVFERVDPTVGRLPIHELFGPSVAYVFSKHVDAGMARAQEQLEKNLIHELKFALSQ